jgi:DNA-directed RNA polymerase subunit RPC12/RpoP
VKCPACGERLDFDLKTGSATCHTCGWKKVLYKKKAGLRPIQRK